MKGEENLRDYRRSDVRIVELNGVAQIVGDDLLYVIRLRV